MKFGQVRPKEALGAMIAHKTKVSNITFKKGHIVTDKDIENLEKSNINFITCAIIEKNDMPENKASSILADAVAGNNLSSEKPFTGRSNITALKKGMVIISRKRVNKFNSIDDSITLATTLPSTIVDVGEIVGTLKIIPFSAPKKLVNIALNAAKYPEPLISIKPFIFKKIMLIITRFSETKKSIIDKTIEEIKKRVINVNSQIESIEIINHDEYSITQTIQRINKADIDLILLSGASAIVDKNDVIPNAIKNNKGKIIHFGMPVDPGNLLLIGKISKIDVIGLPGCARSPLLNGFDWVLERICCGLKVTKKDITEMGCGGLLKDTKARGQKRSISSSVLIPKVTAIIFAAGLSRRMGKEDKITYNFKNKPMISHIVEAALSSHIKDIIIIAGKNYRKIEQIIQHDNVKIKYNKLYKDGLSSSIKAGIKLIANEIDAALFMLGDMPLIDSTLINKMLTSFDPVEGRSIIIPTFHGKRGQPILFSSELFSQISKISGDIGAKNIIHSNSNLIYEIEHHNNSILTDFDTFEDFINYKEK